MTHKSLRPRADVQEANVAMKATIVVMIESVRVQLVSAPAQAIVASAVLQSHEVGALFVWQKLASVLYRGTLRNRMN